ncbi:MAG: alginate export family protein [Marinilabiliaceae bacterium]|nr:alginate export family protein [Marinilabiliaceae bacterium]
MNKHHILPLLMGVLIPTLMPAQDVTINGEFRPRTEMRSGYGAPLTPAVDPGVFTLQRSRVSLTYTTQQLKACVTLQDARTWGETGLTSEATSATGATTVYESWVELLPAPGLTCRMGRQPLAYDDNRLFSASGWSNTGAAHDLMLMRYAIGLSQAHYALAFNNDKAIASETAYSGAMPYRWMQLMWLAHGFNNGLSLSALAVDEGFQEKATEVKKVNMSHRYTAGLHIDYAHEDAPLTMQANGYLQFGKSSSATTDAQGTTTRKQLDAHMMTILLNWTISKKLRMGGGADYFSGNSTPSDTESHTFEKLYGSDHNTNGYMDYWCKPSSWGLTDIYLTARYSPIPQWTMESAVHRFGTAETIANGYGRNLGSELDLTIIYASDKTLTIQAGWSIYWDNDNTRLIKNKSADAVTRLPQWAYVMLTVKPKFL